MSGLEFDVVGCDLVCAMQKGMFPLGINAEYPGSSNEEEDPSPAMACCEEEHLEPPLRAVGELEEHGEYHRRGGIMVRSWREASVEGKLEMTDIVKPRRWRDAVCAVGRRSFF